MTSHRFNRRITFARHAWTAAEDALLREHYPTMGVRVRALMPTRTGGSISSRASVLGLRVRCEVHARNGMMSPAAVAARSLRPLKPKITGEPFSREWYVSQDRAFCAAMQASGEFPSGRGSYNGAGSGR